MAKADSAVDEREELDQPASPDFRDGDPAEADDSARTAGEDTESADAVDSAEGAGDKVTAGRRRLSWVRSVLRWPVTVVRAVVRGMLGKPVFTLILLGVLALLLAGGVTAATIVRHQQTAAADARGAAVDAARSGLTTMLSYSYQTFDKDVAAGSALATGDFQQRYHDLMAGTVRAAALDQQTVTNASVVRSSVVSAARDTVEALLFVNQTTTSKAGQGPQLSASRVQVTMTRVGDRWLISSLTPL